MEKNFFNRKSISIFALQRCAFLFFLFLSIIIRSQIYISGEASVIGKDNIYYAKQGNDSKDGEFGDHAKIIKQDDSLKIQSLLYRTKSSKKNDKKNKRLFISRKEQLERKIKNRLVTKPSNKIGYNLLPKGKDGNDFFVRNGGSKEFIFSSTENHLSAHFNQTEYVNYLLSISTTYVDDFYCFIYKKGKEYIYSVRPPPFLSI